MMARMTDKLPVDVGPGERAETARRRRFSLILSASLIFGLVVGVVTSLTEGPDEGWSTGTMPGSVAAGLAIAYLLIMGTLVLFATKNADEHELSANYWAGNLGAFVYVMVYPMWLFLWKGRLVPEPDHLTLFIILLVAAGAGYLYKKSR